MMVKMEDVQEDFARKDAEIRKLKSKNESLEDQWLEVQAQVNNQNGMLNSFGRREDKLFSLLRKCKTILSENNWRGDLQDEISEMLNT